MAKWVVALPFVLVGLFEYILLILNWNIIMSNTWFLLFKLLIIMIFWVFPLITVGWSFVENWSTPAKILYLFAFIAIPLCLITAIVFFPEPGSELLRYMFWY